MINPAQSLGDGGVVGHHADGALDAGQVAAGDDGGGLVVDAALEAGGAPVDELDGPLGLDGGDGGVDVLGDNVAAVHEAAGHVLAVAGVALGHHAVCGRWVGKRESIEAKQRRVSEYIPHQFTNTYTFTCTHSIVTNHQPLPTHQNSPGRLKDRVGNLGNGQLLVISLLGGDDGSVRGEHEVDAGVRDEVRLELGHVDVEGTIEAEGGRQARDDLGDETVEVGVGGTLDVEVAAADVVQRLVVQAEGAVGVLEEGVGGKDGVVGLDDGGGNLGGGADGEGQLGLAAVIDRETLEEEGAEAGAGATAGGVEDEESLQAGAVVGELADAIEDEVDDLLADGVVATGVVVGGVLLAGDDLLGMVQLAVGSGADLVADGRLEVDVDGAGNVLAGPRLGEEGVEGVVTSADGLVGGHLAVGLDAVLEAVQLPAAVAGLDAGLAHVDRYAFWLD